MGNLQKLKDYIYNSNNDFCFIERERTLNELEKTFSGYNKPDRYARIFSMLLSILKKLYFFNKYIDDITTLNKFAIAVATATPRVSHLIKPVKTKANNTFTNVEITEIINGAVESPKALKVLPR
jgi:hypothetical protein